MRPKFMLRDFNTKHALTSRTHAHSSRIERREKIDFFSCYLDSPEWPQNVGFFLLFRKCQVKIAENKSVAKYEEQGTTKLIEKMKITNSLLAKRAEKKTKKK